MCRQNHAGPMKILSYDCHPLRSPSTESALQTKWYGDPSHNSPVFLPPISKILSLIAQRGQTLCNSNLQLKNLEIMLILSKNADAGTSPRLEFKTSATEYTETPSATQKAAEEKTSSKLPTTIILTYGTWTLASGTGRTGHIGHKGRDGLLGEHARSSIVDSATWPFSRL